MERMNKQETVPTLEKFKVFVTNNSLLETHPSIAGISDNFPIDKQPSIYYGTGICTPTKLSAELPVDVLSMMFVTERMRRQFNMGDIYHHIADTHALSNTHFDRDAVNNLAAKTKESLMKVSENLGLSHFHFVLASEFDQTKSYKEILDSFKSDKHEYVQREVADIEWYRKEKGVYLKTGWIIQSAETSIGNDERVFDREYKDKINGDVSFLYLKAGRTLDKTRPKASPYISVAGESRIHLKKGENVSLKLEKAQEEFGPDKQFGGTRKYLLDILREYEKLYGSFNPTMPFEERLQMIIDKAVK